MALARATFGLLICVALALTSPSGIAGLLPAITAAYAVVGTLAFGRAVREEMHKDLAKAASLYVLALVHELCVVARVFALARFRGAWHPHRHLRPIQAVVAESRCCFRAIHKRPPSTREVAFVR